MQANLLFARQIIEPLFREVVTMIRMEKTDIRRLKPEVQEQLRKQVVRLRKSGKSFKEISEIVGIHFTNTCKIFKAYEKDGPDAIKAKTRGRKKGSCRTLDPEQEKRLKKAITDNTPDQLKFPSRFGRAGLLKN